MGHPTNGGFYDAIQYAYMNHYPLALSAEHIWLKITQGIALHILKNAEALKSVFVNFEGKKTLICVRNEFTKGNPMNDWRGVFAEFNDKIAEYIGKDNQAKLV